MVVSRGPVKQQQQPFQHLRSKHHWQPTQQPSCLPNEQYVNTYILYQTSVECRSNNIKQQQQQTTTQKYNLEFIEFRQLHVLYVYMSHKSIKEENKSNSQTLLYHKTKAYPLTAVFPLNVQLLKIAEPPLI